MRAQFVVTSNVRRFVVGMDQLTQRNSYIPGMALVFGPPGTGKTQTAIWWKIRNGNEGRQIPYVRAVKSMSARWLLECIAYELGELPRHRLSDILEQIKRILIEKPRPIIVDEVDYLCKGGEVQILSDLHDMTKTPIVLLGMGQADKKLMRFPHFFDRISVVVQFELLNKDDIREIADQVCEVKFTDDAVDYLHEMSGGKLRRIMIHLYEAERSAKSNKVREINREYLRNLRKGE